MEGVVQRQQVSSALDARSAPDVHSAPDAHSAPDVRLRRGGPLLRRVAAAAWTVTAAWTATAWVLGLAAGCISGPGLVDNAAPPVPIHYDNPLLVSQADPQQLWEAVADVIDDHFRIEREEPVRVLGGTVTEGRLETFPEVGSTIFEPWRSDSADAYEKWESTLQSIRRYAHARVIPSQGGYLVDVAVYKQLEDVLKPAHASAGSATLRNDGTLNRVSSLFGEQDINKGWITLGRDRALEQDLLGAIQERMGLNTRAASPTMSPRERTVPGRTPISPIPTVAQPGPPGPPCPPGQPSVGQ